VLSIIEAECINGPEDGAVVRAERRPYTKFMRFIPATTSWEESTYALEVTEKGQFRLLHVHTHAVPK
jgi:hypothetical protein